MENNGKIYYIKGNYYRLNSDGTRTKVTPNKNGYFTWVLPNGKTVRSKNGTYYNEDNTIGGDITGIKYLNMNGQIVPVKNIPDKKLMDTNKFTVDEYGNSYYDGMPLSPERRTIKGDASENILNTLIFGLPALARHSVMSVPTVIKPQITIGLPSVITSTIGKTAGNIATGITADEISKVTTGKNIGQNVKDSFKILLPFLKWDDVPDIVWDYTNLFYNFDSSPIISNLSKVKRFEKWYTGVPHRELKELPGKFMDENFYNYTGEKWYTDNKDYAKIFARNDDQLLTQNNGKVFKSYIDPLQLRIMETPKFEIPEYWLTIHAKLKDGRFVKFNPDEESLQLMRESRKMNFTTPEERLDYINSHTTKPLSTDDIVKKSKELGYDATKLYNIDDGYIGPVNELILNENVPVFNSFKDVLKSLNWNLNLINYKFVPRFQENKK